MESYSYFVAFGILQLLHSQEEIWTNFHRRWFIFTMPRSVFVSFEILFSMLIIAYIANPDLPFANFIMPVFAYVMLINGIGHIVWGLVEKKYVPGLITAPFFVAIFTLYYFKLVGLL